MSEGRGKTWKYCDSEKFFNTNGEYKQEFNNQRMKLPALRNGNKEACKRYQDKLKSAKTISACTNNFVINETVTASPEREVPQDQPLDLSVQQVRKEEPPLSAQSLIKYDENDAMDLIFPKQSSAQMHGLYYNNLENLNANNVNHILRNSVVTQCYPNYNFPAAQTRNAVANESDSAELYRN